MNALHRLPVPALLIAVLVLAGWFYRGSSISYTLEEGSALWFNGTSSLHDWSCLVKDLSGTLTLAPDEAASAPPIIEAVTVTIPVASIACGNAVMDSRLADILDADAHPNIVYTLTMASVAGDASDPVPFSTQGHLRVAAVEKPVTMTVQAFALSEGRFRFKGNVPMNMTDFGIEPPAFMNLKTGNEIKVFFDHPAAGSALRPDSRRRHRRGSRGKWVLRNYARVDFGDHVEAANLGNVYD